MRYRSRSIFPYDPWCSTSHWFPKAGTHPFNILSRIARSQNENVGQRYQFVDILDRYSETNQIKSEFQILLSILVVWMWEIGAFDSIKTQNNFHCRSTSMRSPVVSKRLKSIVQKAAIPKSMYHINYWNSSSPMMPNWKKFALHTHRVNCLAEKLRKLQSKRYSQLSPNSKRDVNWSRMRCSINSWQLDHWIFE